MLRSTTPSRLDACRKVAALNSCASCVRVQFIESDSPARICSQGAGCTASPASSLSGLTATETTALGTVPQTSKAKVADFDEALDELCRIHGRTQLGPGLDDSQNRIVCSSIGEGLVLNSAEMTTEAAIPVMDENALLAALEARLADEMRGLGLSLREFALRTKAIREEIPESAKFCKLVAGLFPLAAFQLADALLSKTQRFTFKDDGALYLKELGLEVEDFVREIDLEGRKFLAVAFVDKCGRDVLDGAANRDEL